MITVNSSGLAILLCILTMIGWGSWANTQKLAGRARWPFELFYWDYAIGVAIMGAIFCFSFGMFGSAGMSSVANLGTASASAIGRALGSGALFNLANILLVAAIDSAGMAVAFPVGIGLALVIGTAQSYIQQPKGNPTLLFLGVACVLVAIIVSAATHAPIPKEAVSRKTSGLLWAVAAGLLMGFFYPQLMRAISPGFNTQPIQPGALTPYVALLFFGCGVLVSSIPFNGWFMHSRGSHFSEYQTAPMSRHMPGIVGGFIWMIAMGLNVIASGVAGPAVSYALGQGATLVAALWGVFVWREFRDAPPRTNFLVVIMFIAYAAGLLLIGRAIY